MSATKPLIVRDVAGRIIDVGRTDEKGYKKSIEHRSLWVRHDGTVRLLPFESVDSILGIEDRGGWYEAVVGESVDAKDAPGNAADTQRDADPSSDGAASRRSEASAGASASASGAPAASGATSESTHVAAGSKGETVLPKLFALIEGRKRDMPEGSYTTYLFSEGRDKIRKKTGEEAVELLLAHDLKEVTHEAADLIYHLLVLLVEAGVSLDELLTELESR